jgi:hypothetical protein
MQQNFLTYAAKFSHVRGKIFSRAQQNFLTCAAKLSHVRSSSGMKSDIKKELNI